jgi:cation transport ATPase
VQLAVDGIPQLIITLEETHLAKQESKEVVNYLKNVLKLKVKMITGDN